MASLYEIATEYKAAAAKLEDLDLDEPTLTDTLESMGGDLEAKAQNVVFFARNLEHTAKGIKEAEEALAKRRKAMESRAKGLLRYVQGSMQFAGVKKIEGMLLRLSIQASPPSVDVFDLAALPKDYLREVPATFEPDKILIKKALSDGFEVPGAKLQQGQRLVIS